MRGVRLLFFSINIGAVSLLNFGVKLSTNLLLTISYINYADPNTFIFSLRINSVSYLSGVIISREIS